MNHDQTQNQIAKLQAQDYLGLKLGDIDRLMQVAEEATNLAQHLMKYCRAIEGTNPLTKDPAFYWDEVQAAWNYLLSAAEITPLEADEEIQLRSLNLWKARVEWLEPKQEEEPKPEEEPMQEEEPKYPDADDMPWTKSPGELLKEEDEEFFRPFFPELEED